MSYSDALLEHATDLAISAIGDPRLQEVRRRRSVSAAYYALFHRINGDAVNLIAPNVPVKTNHRIQRWFEHAEMKKICGRFLAKKLDQPLRDLVGESASSDLQTVALAFIDLQDSRHRADYDLSFVFSEKVAWDLLETATDSIEAWDRIQNSAEANIFILSLLMWKNWDKDR